MNTKEDV